MAGEGLAGLGDEALVLLGCGGELLEVLAGFDGAGAGRFFECPGEGAEAGLGLVIGACADEGAAVLFELAEAFEGLVLSGDDLAEGAGVGGADRGAVVLEGLDEGLIGVGEGGEEGFEFLAEIRRGGLGGALDGEAGLVHGGDSVSGSGLGLRDLLGFTHQGACHEVPAGGADDIEGDLGVHE